MSNGSSRAIDKRGMMTAGQIGFFVIIGLLVLSIVVVIIDSWWRGHKGKRSN